MIKTPTVTMAAGSIVTLAAFATGHFIYQYFNQTLGFVIGVLALVPLGAAAFQAWRATGKTWAKILFWTVAGLWIAMLFFSGR